MTTFASRLVRDWVAIYTRGLPHEAQLARRDEIESDLWSQGEEARSIGRSAASLSVEIIARLVLGIAADITWRLEHRSRAERRPVRSADAGTKIIAVLAIVGAIAWGIAIVDWAVIGGPNAAIKIWEQPVVADAGLAGLIAISLSLGGLGYVLLSRFDSSTGLVALTGACCGVMAGFGAWGAIIFLPAASVIAVMALARLHAVPWALALIHAAGVPGIYVGTAAYNDQSLVGVAAAFVLVYCATWIGIGLELFGGLPLPAPNSEAPHAPSRRRPATPRPGANSARS